MARQCPDCGIPLKTQVFQSVEIDKCPQCAGIYFDDLETTELRSHGIEAFEQLDSLVVPTVQADPFEGERLRGCPGCGEEMAKYRYLYSSPVMLDSCLGCGGIWIQDGELKAMAEYVRTQDHPGKNEVVAIMQAQTEAHIMRARSSARALNSLHRYAGLSVR